MIATGATVNGTIFATGGAIGGWTINSDKLSGNGIIQGGQILGVTITGGIIQTASSGSNRIVLSGSGLKTFDYLERLHGIVMDSGNFSEIALYYNGSKRGYVGQTAGIISLKSVYDSSSGLYPDIHIEPSVVSGSYTDIRIQAGSNGSVTAAGNWNFTGNVTGVHAVFL
jgi:hypothetical protein